MAPVFGYGDMRLYLLKLLDEAPRYGYEVIRLLEDRFHGAYTPSAGAIYPRLAALEEEGLVEHIEEDGRKVYKLTDAGRAELESRGSDLRDLESQITSWATDLAKGVLGDVKLGMRGLQDELGKGLVDGLREARRDVFRDLRGDHRRGRGRGREEREQPATNRSLRIDLDAFVADLRQASSDVNLDREQLRRIQSALLDARSAIHTVLDEARDATPVDAEVVGSAAGEGSTEADG
jgi:DNA-binding PadR family transcriptional regulator